MNRAKKYMGEPVTLAVGYSSLATSNKTKKLLVTLEPLG